MNTISGPNQASPRDILKPIRRTGHSGKKSSGQNAYDFSVTGNRNSIHIREPKEPLFKVNELVEEKREDKNQSEFWIG